MKERRVTSTHRDDHDDNEIDDDVSDDDNNDHDDSDDDEGDDNDTLLFHFLIVSYPA